MLFSAHHFIPNLKENRISQILYLQNLSFSRSLPSNWSKGSEILFLQPLSFMKQHNFEYWYSWYFWLKTIPTCTFWVQKYLLKGWLSALPSQRHELSSNCLKPKMGMLALENPAFLAWLWQCQGLLNTYRYLYVRPNYIFRPRGKNIKTQTTMDKSISVRYRGCVFPEHLSYQ